MENKPVEAAKPAVKAVVQQKEPGPDKLASAVDRRRELAVKTLLRWLQQLTKAQLSVLLFLYQHEGKNYDLGDIANWLQYSESSLRKNPPVQLLKLGLVNRHKYMNEFRYTSNFSNFIKENYQGVDPNSIIENISRAL